MKRLITVLAVLMVSVCAGGEKKTYKQRIFEENQRKWMERSKRSEEDLERRKQDLAKRTQQRNAKSVVEFIDEKIAGILEESTKRTNKNTQALDDATYGYGEEKCNVSIYHFEEKRKNMRLTLAKADAYKLIKHLQEAIDDENTDTVALVLTKNTEDVDIDVYAEDYNPNALRVKKAVYEDAYKVLGWNAETIIKIAEDEKDNDRCTTIKIKKLEKEKELLLKP